MRDDALEPFLVTFLAYPLVDIPALFALRLKAPGLLIAPLIQFLAIPLSLKVSGGRRGDLAATGLSSVSHRHRMRGDNESGGRPSYVVNIPQLVYLSMGWHITVNKRHLTKKGQF